MAICKICFKEMTDKVSCLKTPITYAGIDYEPIRYGYERHIHESEFCHDCSTPKGGYHHSGCDVEECPKCHQQFIGCDCVQDKSYEQ